jgi:hypothetical protein
MREPHWLGTREAGFVAFEVSGEVVSCTTASDPLQASKGCRESRYSPELAGELGWLRRRLW